VVVSPYGDETERVHEADFEVKACFNRLSLKYIACTNGGMEGKMRLFFVSQM